ncbi:MAG: DUF3426 domain-containing protein [Rhodospirillales bacterium]|jgi:hypothetical protein|nr:DUF3426 domain-containing protein [Rhodospirillales bacterium]MBT5520907.1 DUF3426 domain-containing protein [Rhodospirillales bacterium]MBT6111915.1 DUF3426 domain-containing protein [Rhodospirillales bacterium]MBT6826239.1 DUF3426 domain-containing protein [Rhodospirillales bacterium]MBT7148412.1 DUF3426 domain-containing protein [Rhodospirillales bacterium]
MPSPEPEMSFPDDDAPVEEPEMNISSGIDALFGDDDDDDDDDYLPEPEPVAEEDPIASLSDEALDDMFEGEDEPDEITSMVESAGDDGDDHDGESLNLDDIPDPDPLPQSLTDDMPDDDFDDDDDDDIPVRRRMSGKKKKSNLGLIIGLVLVVLLSGLGGSLFFLKSMVIEMVPALEPIYEMVGLGTPLGDGLDLGKPSVERGSEGGIDFIMLKGSITNLTGSEKPVPLIKAFLTDAGGDEIQSMVQEPAAAMIPGGEVLAYSIKFEEPSPLARSLEVTFVERPKEEMQ